MRSGCGDAVRTCQEDAMIHASFNIDDVVEYHLCWVPNIRRVTLRQLSVVVLTEGKHAVVLCFCPLELLFLEICQVILCLVVSYL